MIIWSESLSFVQAHLAPQSQTNFDFQKYINRSLEEDFKVVVGISPPIWFFAVLFLLFNTHGEKSTEFHILNGHICNLKFVTEI